MFPSNRTPIGEPEYVVHSKDFFRELGFADSMAQSPDFVKMFSGDISEVPETMRNVGWATGYALSTTAPNISSSVHSKPANGYGDGRAISGT